MSFVVNKMLFVVKKKNYTGKFLEVKLLLTEEFKILF